jgi:hypothetical protein
VSSIKRVAFAGLLAATVSGATITDSHASFVVLPGYDLLLTLPGTQFSYGGNGIPMTGAPDLIRAGNCGSAQWNFGSGCTSIGNTSAILYRGKQYYRGVVVATFYSHTLTPNSRLRDCIRSIGFDRGHLATRSFHTGGSQLVLGDGSVRFVSENIDIRVWRAVGSINGGETVSEW